ncbi:hypothetical protein QQS21_008642 [Conoideocrella luteorostrata]|uniref:Mpv17/PMP22 family protein n=1 Tax=Conoideocrella luteorostrata TaxID=1105319 RepID=A0AAJ0FWC6_9HYPO|nr:hypothetical protein QQS21_008642 [Conoideocrella luteorostrata]
MFTPSFRTSIVRLPFRGLRHQQRLQIRSQSHQSSTASTSSKGAKESPASTPVQTSNAIVGASTASRPIWQRLGPLTKAANAYSRSQNKRPYTTQVVGALVIYLCADLSAQRIGGREYDPVRTGRTLLIGLVAAIPHYQWFVFLSSNFNYTSKFLSIATKVVVNQIILTPTFNTYFFGAQALLSGESIEATFQRIKDTVPTSWVNSFKVWPATVAFSMAFLPFEFRSIFSGFVAVGWQTYLSYLNRQAELLEEARKRMSVTASSEKEVVPLLQHQGQDASSAA